MVSSQLISPTIPIRGQTLIARTKGGEWNFTEQQSWSSQRDFINGGLKRIVLDPPNNLIVLADDAIVRVDISRPLGTSSQVVVPDVSQGKPSGFVDFDLDVQTKRFYTASQNPRPALVRWSSTTLDIVDEPNNPVFLTGDLTDIFKVIFDANQTKVYVVTRQTKIARYDPLDLSKPPEFIIRTDLQTSCAYFDEKRSVMFLCGNNNQVYEVTLNNAIFNSSTWTTHTLTGVNDSLAVILSEERPTESNLYVVTYGTTEIENPASIVKISRGTGSGWTQVTVLKLSDFDVNVADGTIDPNGFIYLTTLKQPPRVIQVSLPSFNWESSIELNNTYVSAYDIFYTPTTRDVFVAAVNLVAQPTLIRGTGALSCEGDCYGHGTCDYRTCTCAVDSASGVLWDQPWCATLQCPFANGLQCGGLNFADACNNGTCICKSRFYGPTCQLDQCPRNCSISTGNGIRCILNQTTGKPDKCVCAEGWAGDDCALKTFLPCFRYKTCGECLQSLQCGWCASNPPDSACVSGTVLGPLSSTCLNWNYQTCPDTTAIVVNGIVIAITLLMLLINGLSMIAEDGRPINEIETREEWYLFQRGSKSYWAFYQLQYMGVVVLLVPGLPTSLLNWIYTCTYTLGFGFGGTGTFPQSSTTPTTKRSLDQFNTLNNNRFEYLAYGAVALWGAVLVGSMIVYAIGVLVAGAVRGGGSRRGTLLPSRFLYIFTRVTDLFYFGIVSLSCAQFASASRIGGGNVAGAAVIFVLFGIVIPLVLMIGVIKTPLNELLKDDAHKNGWMSFYGVMKPRCRKWIPLPWVKRFAIAVAFGAFTNISVVAQLAIAIIISIVYVIVVIISDPYADYLHRYMDLLTTAFTGLSFLPLFGFAANISGNSTAIIGITALFLIFQLLSFVVCIGMFAYSWMQLKGVYQLSQIKNCCAPQ